MKPAVRTRGLAKTKDLVLRFSWKPVNPPFAARTLTQRFNPIRPKVLHLLENRDPNTLWWRVSIAPCINEKPVVQSWLGRRVRMAFKQELKTRGFDAEGRKLNLDSAAAGGLDKNMTGTAWIIINPTCIHKEYSRVQLDMKTLMDALIQEQKAPKPERP
ncbi:hypothetical protein BJX99DRAFT_233523 [Aspergillus californicus]